MEEETEEPDWEASSASSRCHFAGFFFLLLFTVWITCYELCSVLSICLAGHGQYTEDTTHNTTAIDGMETPGRDTA